MQAPVDDVTTRWYHDRGLIVAARPARAAAKETPMIIDVRSPEGNTFVALGIAARLLRERGAPQSEIDNLSRAVFSAANAKAARDAIETATQGGIRFTGLAQ